MGKITALPRHPRREEREAKKRERKGKVGKGRVPSPKGMERRNRGEERRG